MMKKFRTSGTIWYSNEAEYFAFRDACDDGDNFSATYGEWLAKAQAQIDYFAAGGMATIKIKADVGEFIRWCELHFRRPDSASRSLFAALKSGEKSGRG